MADRFTGRFSLDRTAALLNATHADTRPLARSA
jgi:hypothetical protein